MRQHKRNLSDPSGEPLLGHDGVRGVEEPRSCPGGDDTRRALLFCPQQGSVLLVYVTSIASTQNNDLSAHKTEELSMLFCHQEVSIK